MSQQLGWPSNSDWHPRTRSVLARHWWNQPTRIQVLNSLMLAFSEFILEFSQRYSFNGRRRACTQWEASDHFVNFEDLSAQSFRGAHRGKVVCVFVGEVCVRICERRRIQWDAQVLTHAVVRFPLPPTSYPWAPPPWIGFAVVRKGPCKGEPRSSLQLGGKLSKSRASSTWSACESTVGKAPLSASTRMISSGLLVPS